MERKIIFNRSNTTSIRLFCAKKEVLPNEKKMELNSKKIHSMIMLNGDDNKYKMID
jgi:hypothetical protein